MLNHETNKLLTEVGPGTRMGDYLRRYWQPFAGVSEFKSQHTRPVRLFGEDLVVYKDLSGNYGLVDRHCAHRRADLSYGFPEKNGLRCAYHGWCFDAKGNCVAQPFDDAADPAGQLKKKVKLKSYPVKELGGMLWAYMGAGPAPELPRWDLFNMKNGFAQAIFSVVPCNWLQCQENSIDPVHLEWAHNNWIPRQLGVIGEYAPTHKELSFEEFEYGFIYRRIREGESKEDWPWKIGRATLWPNAFYLGQHFEYRVPIDDENTLSIIWVFGRVPKEQEPYVQKEIPTWWGPVKDQSGRWITSHVANQDFAVWAGQETVTDRTKEFLGRSDIGIVRMRKLFLEELDRVAQGEEPKGIIRDPELAKEIILPSACRDEMVKGLSREEQLAHVLLGPYLRYMFIQYGQPSEVARAYEEAIGQKMEKTDEFELHGSGLHPDKAQGSE